MDEHTATEQAYKNGYEKGYADAKAELVRCKDCKYSFKNNGREKNGCPINDASIWMDGDDFCSYGERRVGE